MAKSKVILTSQKAKNEKAGSSKAVKSDPALPNSLSAFLTPDLDFLFWPPQFLGKPSAWWTHVPFAHWLIKECKPRVLVELGTHYGISFVAFCEAVLRTKADTKCIAVDTWQGDDQAGFYTNAIYEQLQSHVQENYKHFASLKKMTFEQALPEIADGSVDLLHIDGRHGYEDVKDDYESWLPKLSSRAVVLFHDSNADLPGFGVKQFFDEVSGQHPHFAFEHGWGLGVLLVGRDAPTALIQLCKLQNSKTGAVLRARFQQMGTVLDALIWENHVQAHKNSAAHMQTKKQEVAVNSNKADEKRTNDTANPLVSLVILAKKMGLTFGNGRGAALSIALLKQSPFLDSVWYAERYPDVALRGMGAAEHYFHHGADEGRDPGPFFSTKSYVAEHLDVIFSGLNPLMHFELYRHQGDRMAWLRWPEIEVPYPDKLWKTAQGAIESHIGQFKKRPIIAVAMPVYDPVPDYLEKAIQSVQSQIYPHWELCIANDASTNPEISKILDRYSAQDPRIKVVHRKKNGHISLATNSALELVTSEFVALMDHDDLLHPTALYEVANLLQKPDGIDIIYSDEDTIDAEGKRKFGYFKSDFSFELLLGHNMVSHLGVYRMSILREIGGLRVGFEGSQDYDLVLRALMKSDPARVKHIPMVLYHWRQGGSQKSFSEQHAKKCTDAARLSIQAYLDYEGEGAVVTENPEFRLNSRIHRKLPSSAPLVSCIIQTRNGHDLLRTCVNGLLHKTDYPNIEIIIVDNGSDDPKTLSLLDELKLADKRVRVFSQPGPYSVSALNNSAVNVANGSVIALLNASLEVSEAGWLQEMVSHAIRKGVGAVGAKLFSPNGNLQHAGVTIGLGGTAGHSFSGLSGQSVHYFAIAVLTRTVSAVAGDCLIIEKAKFLEVGGFDTVHLPVAYNDIDFCLRLMERGYRNIWTPFAKLVLHESISHGSEDTREKQQRAKSESAYFVKRWAEVVKNDPFYNPNLTLKQQDYSLGKYSRRVPPWM